MSNRVHIFLDGQVFEAAPGERLLDILDEFDEFRLSTECRAAHCGACRVRVLEGAEALLPPQPEERETLKNLQAGPSQRLGCQLIVGTTLARVTLQRLAQDLQDPSDP